MKYEDILKECEQMQAELECVIPTDGDLVVEHATKLASYLARSGYLLAEAKKIVRIKKSSEISDMIANIAKESFLSAKTQNALVDSIASEEMYLVDWLDRLNAGFTHTIDLCRSIISKNKEELKLIKTGY